MRRENLVRGFPVKTFSRSVVESFNNEGEFFWRYVSEFGLLGEVSSEESIGVFNSPLLPRSIGVTEEGVYAKALMSFELNTVIERKGVLGPVLEKPLHLGNDALLGNVFSLGDIDIARSSIMKDEKGGSVVFGRDNGVSLPITDPVTFLDYFGAFFDGSSMGDHRS